MNRENAFFLASILVATVITLLSIQYLNATCAPVQVDRIAGFTGNAYNNNLPCVLHNQDMLMSLILLVFSAIASIPATLYVAGKRGLL